MSAGVVKWVVQNRALLLGLETGHREHDLVDMPNSQRDYLTSTVARCIYAFITGGSMKAYGVLTEFIVRRLNIPHCVIGCVLSLQQSVGYLAGK